MSDINPIEMQRYLKGVDYPAGRDALLDAARDADAPDDVIDRLKQLPDQQYEKPTDVSHALSQE